MFYNITYYCVILLATQFFFTDFENFGTRNVFVEQEIDTIAVAHIGNGSDIIFFFDFVQNEWQILDHKWLASGMSVRLNSEDNKWHLFWYDSGDACWRNIIAANWYETWENESPFAENNNKPWFARAIAPGLKQPVADAK